METVTKEVFNGENDTNASEEELECEMWLDELVMAAELGEIPIEEAVCAYIVNCNKMNIPVPIGMDEVFCSDELID